MDQLSPFARFVSTEREKREWSQRKLAEKAGVSSGIISLIERDKVTTTTTTAHAIADALGFDRSHVLDILAQSFGDGRVDPPIHPQAMRIAQEMSRLPDHLFMEAYEEIVQIVGRYQEQDELSSAISAMFQYADGPLPADVATLRDMRARLTLIEEAFPAFYEALAERGFVAKLERALRDGT